MLTRRCPKCSDDLDSLNSKFRCWNKACDFDSYRPWIEPPRKKESSNLSFEKSLLIGECLKAAVFGPFFIDVSNKDDPYWEYQTLLGFDVDEVRVISSQWPNVDERDKFVSELISLCITWLIGYPHTCEKYWNDYISISRKELSERLMNWRTKFEKRILQNFELYTVCGAKSAPRKLN